MKCSRHYFMKKKNIGIKKISKMQNLPGFMSSEITKFSVQQVLHFYPTKTQ